MKKFLVGAFGTLCIIITVFIFVGMFSNPDKKPGDKNLSEVEIFARDNNVSTTLAESIENALSQCEAPDSLKYLKDWKQIEDYAEGQRYTTWSYSNKNEKYYNMTFYVKDDVVVSIRDRDNGLEFLYNSEE